MKTYCLPFAFLILALNFSFGEIKNGYAKGITAARESLKGLHALLKHEKEITSSQKKMIETKIKEVVNYIAYYELTENLLKQFRLIASDLYNEIDTIKDRQGRSTDVYIKFIPREQTRVQAWGITNIARVVGDSDAYYSEYGERSVSVKVWVVSKALEVLSHELGHVKYQVPNLASYLEYHKMNYRPGITEQNNIGHDPNDTSGKNATAFAKRYRENYYNHWKNGHNQFQSPLVLMENIRKEVHPETMVADPLARL
jgi:hypothetical protein